MVTPIEQAETGAMRVVRWRQNRQNDRVVEACWSWIGGGRPLVKGDNYRRLGGGIVSLICGDKASGESYHLVVETIDRPGLLYRYNRQKLLDQDR